MKVGYRRYSGPLYLSTEGVKSKRGAWLEKRIAFIEALEERGHTIEYIKNGDPFDQDVVFVEFGSLNKMFHKEDIEYSEQIAKTRPAIFLLDDPDLMPRSFKNFQSIWLNGDAKACRAFWRHPNLVSFPFFGLQKPRSATKDHNGRVVYYGGTGGGRMNRIAMYRRMVPQLDLYGVAKEFPGLGKIHEPPAQSERSDFYNSFMGCLNVQDRKHKYMKWNTGRKYHAILAGCPVIEEYEIVPTIAKQLQYEPFRFERIEDQQASLIFAESVCDDVFSAYGL